MARVVVTVPGERVVEEFTALVSQPTTPSPLTPPPHIGVVEISQSQPTELIPGPMGPAGVRGSRWYTGDGPPAVTGALLGDMYVDNISGDVWVWDGDSWEPTGTNIQGSPDTGPQILAKLAPVDGAASGLDADLLDGQHGAYYLDWVNQTGKPATFPPTVPIPWTDVSGKPATFPPTVPIDYSNISNKPSTFPPTLPIPSSGVTGLDAKQTSQDTAINTKIGPDAPNDGKQYVRQSLGWAEVSVPPGTFVGDSPPASPISGQLWFKSNEGNTYVFYIDPSGPPGQWTQVNVLPASAQFPVATAQTRNRIINGAMQISQENGNAAGTTNAYYAADQWFTANATDGTLSFQRMALVTPKGSPYRIRATVTVADASLAATQYASLRQMMEGVRVADFGWGAASARQVVLRFGWKSPAGTYSFRLYNSTGSRTYVATFTVSAGQANADTEQTLVIPGDTVGALPVDTSAAFFMDFVLASGTTYQGVAGWQAGNFFGTSSNINGLATGGAVYELFDVGLYLDPNNTGVAPAWQMPDEAEELRACQRYYFKADNSGSGTMGMLGYFTAPTASAVNSYAGFIQFPVPMRIGPTITILTAPTMTQCSALSFTATDPLIAAARVTASATANVQYRAWGGGVFGISARM